MYSDISTLYVQYLFVLRINENQNTLLQSGYPSIYYSDYQNFIFHFKIMIRHVNYVYRKIHNSHCPSGIYK